MIMRANEDHLPWEELKGLLAQLIAAIKVDDYLQVRELLQQMVSGYTPDAEIVDLIYRQRGGAISIPQVPARPQVVVAKVS
ncbi:hypothetical protein D3C84_1136560 [compost metagenome]